MRTFTRTMAIAAIFADEGIGLCCKASIVAAKSGCGRAFLADGRCRLRHRLRRLHLTVGKKSIDRRAILLGQCGKPMGDFAHHRIGQRRTRQLFTFIDQANGKHVGRRKARHPRLGNVRGNSACQSLFPRIGIFHIETIGRGARRVAIAAAADVLDEIAAPLHLRFFTRLIFRYIEMATLPERNRRLTAIGKGNLMVLRHGIGCDERVDIGLDVEHILGFHTAIGGVGHDRIKIVTFAVDPLHHRIEELGIAPAADAIGMGRNIRRVEFSDRRIHLKSTGQDLGIPDRSMASGATGCVEQIFAIIGIGLVGRIGIVRKSIAGRYGAWTLGQRQHDSPYRQNMTRQAGTMGHFTGHLIEHAHGLFPLLSQTTNTLCIIETRTARTRPVWVSCRAPSVPSQWFFAAMAARRTRGPPPPDRSHSMPRALPRRADHRFWNRAK